jgi:hypothetical protein
MPKMGRPRRTTSTAKNKTHSRSAAPPIVATTQDENATTAATTASRRPAQRTKRQSHHHDDVFDTTGKDNDMTNDSNDNDEELRIYNEQIRYSEAIEFVQQQMQLLESSRDQSRKDKSTTHSTAAASVTTTTTNTINGRILLTRGMVHTLMELQTKSCTCPLCHGIYIQPITLVSCTHTFCKTCIHQHTDHSWYCPSTFVLFIEIVVSLSFLITFDLCHISFLHF